MTPKREFVDYLQDMLNAIERAAQFTRGMEVQQFRSDDKTVFAVIRALEIIGEAAKNVPDEVRVRYPQVPWREVAGIRDKPIHEYFGINLDVVWKTVQLDVPKLKPLVTKMLQDAT